MPVTIFDGGEFVLRITFVQDLIAFHSRPEVGSDVISGDNVGQAGLEMIVKFGDSSTNGSRDRQQRAVRFGIFDIFFATVSDRKQLVTSYPAPM